MSDSALRGPIEAILMVASEPVAPEELADALGVEVADVADELRALAREYLGEEGSTPRGFELREVAGGWRIYSARAYADVVGRFVVGSTHARLSQAALETLAVLLLSGSFLTKLRTRVKLAPIFHFISSVLITLKFASISIPLFCSVPLLIFTDEKPVEIGILWSANLS